MDGDLSQNGRTGTTSSAHVVVLGGGISGLAAAHRLLRTTPETRVTLIEAAERLGGKIVTEHVDGFLVEGGPDSFLATKPRGVGLCEEVGLGDRLQGVTPQRRRAFVLSRGRLHDLPEGLSGLVPTRLAPLVRSSLLSPTGKARVALDYVLPRREIEGDESLGGFIRRRLGGEAWERLVEPLMAGIYAADGDDLSLMATFPQLRDAELRYGGLIKGVLASRSDGRAAAAPASSPFLTPVDGLGELIAAIAARLRAGGVAIRTGVAATAIVPATTGYAVHESGGATVAADAVIIATPAFVAADLIGDMDPALAGELAAIPHVSTAIVTLAYRDDDIPHPLDGHGYVVPRGEGGAILACTWSSRKWAGRAPSGWELMRVFIGRAGREDVLAGDDESLFALARREIADRLGVQAAPALQCINRWPRGMPQYLLGHPERVVRIACALREHPGLFVAGNAYHGVGLPDCIASGERAAESAIGDVNALAATGSAVSATAEQ